MLGLLMVRYAFPCVALAILLVQSGEQLHIARSLCYKCFMSEPWMNREYVTASMEGFLSRFDSSNPKIALKIRHTYRVAEVCDRIAREEGFSYEVCDAAWVAGMLHDIGRFVQLQEYDTFMDAKSLNHAELSSRMLFDEGLIEEFIDIDACNPLLLDAMQTAIALHSAWRLPDDLDGITQDLCVILRDADKVDILRVNCEEPTEVIYPFTESELLDSSLSDEAKVAFDAKSTIQTPLKKLPADFALGHCAFGWELEFPSSKRMAVEQGYLRQLFNRSWRIQGTREYFQEACARMFEWLEEGSSSIPS